MTFRLVTSSFTHQGKREYQEDSLDMDTSLNIFTVCDGLGGHSNGALASAFIAQNFKFWVSDAQAKYHVAHPEYSAAAKGGLTTLVSIQIFDDGTPVGFYSGDSHLMHFRRDESGKLTLLQAAPVEGNMRGEVFNCLDSSSHARSFGRIKMLEMQKIEVGDVFLLASDGLDTLFPDYIYSVNSRKWTGEPLFERFLDLLSEIEPGSSIDSLIMPATTVQYADNCTAIVIWVA